jgi:hypothetical protein
MTDLDAALGFVFRRVEEQAALSGEPLGEEERELLHNLPKYPTQQPGIRPQLYGDGAFEIQLPIRDVAYERLCTAAKEAYERSDPRLKASWEFASAVTKLNGHPAAWLFDWAGVKVKHRKPRWDRLLLVGFAILVVLVGMILVFAFVEGSLREPIWATVAAVCAAILTVLFMATKRIEQSQLRQNIEKLRHEMNMPIA